MPEPGSTGDGKIRGCVVGGLRRLFYSIEVYGTRCRVESVLLEQREVVHLECGRVSDLRASEINDSVVTGVRTSRSVKLAPILAQVPGAFPRERKGKKKNRKRQQLESAVAGGLGLQRMPLGVLHC